MSEINELLYYAVLNGDLEEVQLLLNKGGDVNSRFGSKLDSFLHIATHVPVIQELLQRGADVNALNRSGESPILRAVVDGKGPQVVSTLLSANADVKHRYCSETLLHYTSDVKIIRLLLASGVDINSTNVLGRTALHYAAETLGALLGVRELIKCGANVNAVDSNGETPLHCAVSSLTSKIIDGKIYGFKDYHSFLNAVEVVHELLDNGADINVHMFMRGRDPQPSTLGLAINCRYLPLIKMIIKLTLINHIDIDYRDLIYLYPFRYDEFYIGLRDYLEECAYEIAKIKTENVSVNFLLRDFVGFERKRNIIPLYHVDEERIRENFPHYCDTILSRLQLNIERGKLLEKLRDFPMQTEFVSSGKKIVVNPDCMRKIGEHLSNDDLKHLMEALGTKN